MIKNAATKNPPKSIEFSKNGNSRPAAVMEKHPENQRVFSSPAIILGTKSFSEAFRSRRDKNKLGEFLKETTFSNATIIE